MDFLCSEWQGAVNGREDNVCLTLYCRTRSFLAVATVCSAHLRGRVLTVRVEGQGRLKLVVRDGGDGSNVEANALPYRLRNV